MECALEATAYRPVDGAILPRVVDAMGRSAFKVAGASDRALYEVIGRDSLHPGQVCIQVAAGEKRIEGFLIVIIDWKRYWMRRLLRHPVAALRTVWGRVKRSFRPKSQDCAMSEEARRHLASLIGISRSGRRWEQSDKCIGKVLFVYVEPAGRGRSIAHGLYRNMFDELRRRGVERCDARIDCDNLASVRAHLKAGFRIEMAGRSLFATIDL